MCEIIAETEEVFVHEVGKTDTGVLVAEEIIKTTTDADGEVTVTDEIMLKEDPLTEKESSSVAASTSNNNNNNNTSPANTPKVVQDCLPSNAMPPVKQGFISKEGQFMRNWNLRYFVLGK